MLFIEVSSLAVNAGSTICGQYLFSRLMILSARGVASIRIFLMYPRRYRISMIPALVAFVPMFSSSILRRRLLGLYRGGGSVNFWTAWILVNGIMLPTLRSVSFWDSSVTY